jgi:hypothetical protein
MKKITEDGEQEEGKDDSLLPGHSQLALFSSYDSPGRSDSQLEREMASLFHYLLGQHWHCSGRDSLTYSPERGLRIGNALTSELSHSRASYESAAFKGKYAFHLVHVSFSFKFLIQHGLVLRCPPIPSDP